QITTKVPAAATSGPISVVTPNGTVTSDGFFTVTPSSASPPASSGSGTTASAPAISGTSPASGPVGQSVGIGGKFFTGATAVRFNGTDADFTVVSETQITAHVPVGATSGPLTVVTPQGTATSPGNFTLTTAAPTIESFSPGSGAPGGYVTIAGHNFTGTTSVK